MPKSHPGGGFDYTAHMRRLCVDIAARLPELRHIDFRRVAVSFCQARKAVAHGLYASVTPMRFEDGRMHVTRRGRTWTVQRLFDASGAELLYVLSFYLPRFQDAPLSEKLNTILHELWHFSPHFNGDLRRFAGRCYAHSGSQDAFDRHAARLADRWLAERPPESLYQFLRVDFRQLRQQHGTVFGTKIPTPKLIPVRDAG